MKDWVLALDFDGVIWDSVGECYVMARRAAEKLTLDGAKACEEAFRAGRWLVRTGGDFLLLLELAQQHSPQELQSFSKERFQHLRLSRKDVAQEFEATFYRERHESRTRQPEAWLSFQRPYPKVLSQFPELKAAFKAIALCTTKDEPSAKKLLKSAEIDIPIWGREKGVHKGDQVQAMCRELDHQPEKVIFIDDLIENLEQVEPLKVRPFLATWGYNTESERQSSPYPLIREENLLDQLLELTRSS